MCLHSIHCVKLTQCTALQLHALRSIQHVEPTFSNFSACVFRSPALPPAMRPHTACTSPNNSATCLAAVADASCRLLILPLPVSQRHRSLRQTQCIYSLPST